MNQRLTRWAEKVLRRDDWTCQNSDRSRESSDCGANTCLDAAHIQSCQQRPDLYETMEKITDRLEDVANVLQGVIVKMS